jgi:hypothetical protein
MKNLLRWTGAAAGVAAAAYGLYVAVTWTRYGHPRLPRPDEDDDLLDHFIPDYDIVERHRIRVDAPAATTLAAARDMRLLDVPLARAIFKGRELLLGSTPTERPALGILDETLSLGWAVLAERPGREVVVGAVARPWEADVIFRPVPADEYRWFDEPDYVKIVWTLRADPIGDARSIFRTETRAVATDAAARAKFRRYWALLSPGILLIRRAMLRPLRDAAERRAQEREIPGGRNIRHQGLDAGEIPH